MALGAETIGSTRSINKVLLVDDDELGIKSVARGFARQGVDPFAVTNCADALRVVQQERPELAVLDLFLTPPENGLQFLAHLKQFDPSIFCILVSAHMSVAHAVMAIRAGADDVFLKPYSAQQALHRAHGGEPPPKLQVPTLEQIEWEHIARVLGDYDGNITHAAEALGVWRQSLQRKIAKHAPRVLTPDELPETTRPTRGPRRRNRSS